MKKLFISLFIMIAASAFAGSKYDDWLNQEVKVIITKQERDAFKALKTDAEKEQFIKGFWSKRDYSPDTEVNEYKDNYERLLVQVNEKVKSKKHKGFETDMGQTLLLLGPPDKMEDVEEKPRPAGGGDEEEEEEEAPPPSSKKKWSYEKLLKEVSDGPVEILFQGDPYSGEWKFDDAKAVQPLLDKARQHPIDQAAKVAKEYEKFQAEQKARKEEAERQTAAIRSVLDSVVAGNVPHDIPFDVTVDAFMTSTGEMFSTIGINCKSDVDKANVGIRVLDSAGKTVKELFLPFEGQGEKAKSFFQAEIPYSAGDERVVAVVTTGEKSGGIIQAVTIPDLTSKLSLSSIILTGKLDKLNDPKPEKEPYTFGQVKLYPQVDGVFTKPADLYVFYEVYNAQMSANGQPNLEQVITMQKDKQVAQTGNPEVPKGLVTGKKMTVGTGFNLGDLPSGDYKLTITITDKNTGQKASRETKFTVK